MLDVKNMSGAELRDHVRLVAMLMAQRRYLRTRPGADEDAATAWAMRHWRQFEDRAWTALAFMAAQREAAESCGLN